MRKAIKEKLFVLDEMRKGLQIGCEEGYSDAHLYIDVMERILQGLREELQNSQN
jgi:hypothetical protein